MKPSRIIVPLLLAAQLYTSQASSQSDPDTSQARDPELVQIESRLRKQYGLDTLALNFEVLPKDHSYAHLGYYEPADTSLRLNYYEILKSAKNNDTHPDSLIKNVILHELVHYDMDRMRKNLHLRSYMEDRHARDIFEVYSIMLLREQSSPGSYRDTLRSYVGVVEEELTNFVLSHMIDEGIAMYYSEPGVEFVQVTWPESVGSIKDFSEYYRIVYDTGSFLMRPIISKYGDKGAEYVFKHMPTPEDFPKLLEYQRKVLEELAK